MALKMLLNQMEIHITNLENQQDSKAKTVGPRGICLQMSLLLVIDIDFQKLRKN